MNLLQSLKTTYLEAIRDKRATRRDRFQQYQAADQA